MLIDIHDDEVVAFGWPWHGLVKVGSDVKVEMQNGAVKTLEGVDPRNFYLGGNATWVFDKGRPDIPDPVVEAEGGAWWGRAIMRDGLFWTGATWAPDSSGRPQRKIQDFAGFPLWWADAPEHRTERAYVEITKRLSHLPDELYINIPSLQRSFWVPLPLENIGQGLTHPPVAALKGTSLTTWGLAGVAAGDIDFIRVFCGAHQNKLLFMLLAQANSGAETIPTPRALSSDSLSGAIPPRAPCGLIEVELDRGLFGPAPDPAVHVTVSVIEDRQQALGNPQHSRVTGGHTLPLETLSTITETASETSALLTAWYSPTGEIRTVRYNRTQRVASTDKTLRTSAGTWDGRKRTYANQTTVELLYNGTVVDSKSLNETIEIDALPTSYSFARTISSTGEEDDVATFYDDRYRGTGGGAFEVQADRAGGSLSSAAYAYILMLDGVDVLRKQDIRMMHLTRHSNNVASICTSIEPYDYPEGQTSYAVRATSGGAIGPDGPAGGPMSATLTKRQDPGPFWARSFFSSDTSRWVLGAGNPLTGQIVRAADHYAGSPPGGYRLTWV